MLKVRCLIIKDNVVRMIVLQRNAVGLINVLILQTYVKLAPFSQVAMSRGERTPIQASPGKTSVGKVAIHLESPYGQRALRKPQAGHGNPKGSQAHKATEGPISLKEEGKRPRV